MPARTLPGVPAGSGITAVLATVNRVLPLIVTCWLAGVVLLLSRVAAGWSRVKRLQTAALASPASPWHAACRRIAQRLGLPAVPHVVESGLVEVPTVLGWMRPVIVLPIAALANLTPNQVEAILAHELAHIRRHDYAINVLQTVAETLLFYHPCVWWVSARIRAEREHCCDDVAIGVCGDAVHYVDALVELETRRIAGTSLALAATDGSLFNRIRRLLSDETPDQSRSPGLLVTLALTAFLVAGAGAFTWLPGAIDDGWGRRADGRTVQRLTERSTRQDQGTSADRADPEGDRTLGLESDEPPDPPEAPSRPIRRASRSAGSS